jgi:hypothetical protein
MGHIKEPAGIDFIVDPTPLTAEDRKKISEIIAFYKQTGRKMPLQKSSPNVQVSRDRSKAIA